MMRNATVAVTLATATVICVSSAAFAQAGGGRAGAFLRIPIGARPAGMGNAFVAIADDGDALYYNPGGLYQIPRLEVGGTYSLMSMGRKHYAASLVYSDERLGALGLMLIGFGVSDLDGRDAAGNPTGGFDNSELAVSVAYGRRILGPVGIGAGIKYLSHSLAQNRATGLGFDVGAHSKLDLALGPLRSLRLGVSLANLGAELNWDTQSSLSETVSSVLRVGAGVGLLVAGVDALLAIEANQAAGEAAKLQGGLEILPFAALGLRAGLLEDDLRFGFSVNVRAARLDYAYSPDALEEGATSRIGFRVSF